MRLIAFRVAKELSEIEAWRPPLFVLRVADWLARKRGSGNRPVNDEVFETFDAQDFGVFGGDKSDNPRVEERDVVPGLEVPNILR